MRRLAVVCILVMAGFTRTARADLASSIYGDVQDVVQELIETEVTTSVVAKLKDKSPALGFYMHGTLERMASPYWGSLGRTLKSEITVLIADFVYWHMTNTSGPNHAPERDIAKSATAFFQCAIGKTTNTPECKRLLDAVAHARPLLDVECKRRMSERDHRTACDVGLAVQAALEGRKEVRHHVIDALTNVVLQEVGKDRELLEAASTILSRWLDKLDGTIPVALFEALGSPEMIEQLKDESLEKLCGRPTGEKPPAIGPKDVQKNVDWQKDVLLWNRDVKSVRDNANAFFDDFTKPGWICQALATPSARAAFDIVVTVRDPNVPAPLETETIAKGALKTTIDGAQVESLALSFGDPDKITEDRMFRALSDAAVGKMCVTKEGAQNENCDVKPGPGTIVTVSFMGWNYQTTIPANPADKWEEKPGWRPMYPQLARFSKGMKRVRELKALVPPSLRKFVFADTPSAMTNKALRSLAQMMMLVTELRSRWYLWGDGKQDIAELDIIELLQVARHASRSIPGGSDPLSFLDLDDAKAALKDLEKDDEIVAKVADRAAAKLDIQDLFRYVVRQDFRALAMESLRAALAIKLGDPSRPEATFFMTLAAYLLDAGDGATAGVGDQVARSAFKASAKELLLRSSTRGVPRLGDRHRVNLFPRVGLRLAFNDSFAVSSTDTRRNVLAVDWPTAMFAFTDYAGVEVSVLDLAAPLAELALRDPVKYDKQGNVLADIVRPRLGLWVAVPAISRRIALDVGVGMRLLETKVTERDAMGIATRAEYGAHASFVADAGIQFVF